MSTEDPHPSAAVLNAMVAEQVAAARRRLYDVSEKFVRYARTERDFDEARDALYASWRLAKHLQDLRFELQNDRLRYRYNRRRRTR